MFYIHRLFLFIETLFLECFVKSVTTSCKYRDGRYKVIVAFGHEKMKPVLPNYSQFWKSWEDLKIANSMTLSSRTWTAGSVSHTFSKI